MEMTELVPFGKHKGQPIAQLAADPSYCDWLRQQAWLRDRYPGIHTLIINNFGEPEETPEHNALQLRFLDPLFCAAVSALVFGIPLLLEEVEAFQQAVSVPSSKMGISSNHGGAYALGHSEPAGAV